MEVPGPNDDRCSDNHTEEQIKINVVSHSERQPECDFHTIILDCSSWNQVDTVGVKTLMSVRKIL